MPGKQGRRRTSPGRTIESLDVDMNRCQKYTDWITESATGALAPSRGAAIVLSPAWSEAECRESKVEEERVPEGRLSLWT
jgi:hypothetical protein